MQPPNDILNFIDSATSKNTFEKTRSDVKKVKEFLAGEHESRDLDEITFWIFTQIINKNGGHTIKRTINIEV